MKFFQYLTLSYLLLLTAPTFAQDIVKWSVNKNVENYHKRSVILAALDKTIAEYGPYTFDNVKHDKMTTARTQEVVNEGSLLNVYATSASMEWDEKAIAIHIPISRGVANYRLLMVHKDNVNKFRNITSNDYLKVMKAGSRKGWSITNILESSGFNVVLGKKYNGMFLMLDGGRFDFLPLGINEIHKELEKRKNELDLVIEPRLALNIPSPTYIYVSPQVPRLAKRIEAGLELMVEDGSLEKLTNKYYGKYIKKSNLQNRHIIHVSNPLLSPQTPLKRKELWYDFSQEDGA